MSSATNITQVYQWGHSRRFNACSEYFRRLFGSRIQKLSIDAGFTCPNRDGTKGAGGCTYCNNDAFNPGYCKPEKSITEQIREGIDFHKWRYRKACSYLAYFQAFSNTYAPLTILKEKYEEALNYPGVIGIVIGTRPDCMDEIKLDYLKDLSRNYHIVVEYGIESCYNKTLKRINRCHTFENAVDIIEKTAGAGIKTGAHLIFGLPGESRTEMLAEAGILSEIPLTTVKFHQLQIMKDTVMESEFIENPDDFILFSLKDYISFIIEFLELLNPKIVVERFTGEAPPRFLAHIPWGNIRAEQVGIMIEKRLEELDTWQGRLYQQAMN